MIKLIKKHLLDIIDNIDSGNSNLTQEEEIKLLKVIKDISTKDNRMSKYQAYTYLNVGRATFDNLVREGKLPKGKHIAGFKELSWNKSDLDDYIKNAKHR